MQTRLAHDLHEKANVSIGPYGLEKVKQFQTYLSDYQINIVSKDHQNSIIYSGPEKEKRIYLFLHDNHYDVITSMPAFFARKRYCHRCKKAYDHVTEHLCPDSCQLFVVFKIVLLFRGFPVLTAIVFLPDGAVHFG